MINSKHLNSLKYYKEFADLAKARSLEVPAAHKSLFEYEKHLQKYYEELYIKQRNKIDKELRRKYEDDFCKSCSDFFTQKQKKINKKQDLILGKRLEDCFQEFIQQKLSESVLKSLITTV